MSNVFEDYEVISILGTNISSAYYKVYNKSTSNVEVWRAVNLEILDHEKRQELLDSVNRRISQQHPNLLRFYDYILHEETNTMYIVTEYCKFGSLANLLQNCVKANEYLAEDFIWKILYKITYGLKNLPESECDKVATSAAEIYLDEQYNIKFYCFSIENYTDTCTKVKKEINIGSILHELCTLECKSTDNLEMPSYYSSSLKSLLQFLMESDFECLSDIILHHPTALMKIMQKDNGEIFIKLTNPPNYTKNCMDNNINSESEEFLNTCMQNIQNKELMLKVYEAKLKEREHSLNKREKKLVWLEKITKQKMTQADQFLRRSRSRRNVNANIVDKSASYDKLDTSFSADCGDSAVIPTSKKIDIDEIPKPYQFARAMSERRVKFKGHSPLKEIHNIPSRDRRKLKQPVHSERRNCKSVESWDSENSNKSKGFGETLVANSEKSLPNEKVKKKFSFSSVFLRKTKKCDELLDSHDLASENKSEITEDLRPISWTEKNKRHAFELLRIMNDDRPSSCNDKGLKLTYL